MNFLQKNRPKNRIRKVLLVCGFFIFFAVGFYLFGGSVVRIFSPIWQAENSFSRMLGKGVGILSSKQSLIDENLDLKEKLFSLEAELVNLRSQEQIPETLAALTGRESGQEFKAAGVLTRPPQSPYDILVIDLGADEGAYLGEEVLLPQGAVVGRVSEVLAKSSKVKLFSSVGEETAAVLERHSIPITLVGAGAGNFKITAPRDTEVMVGDRILSADISSRLVAVVGEVEENPTESFKEVLAVSPVNIFALRFVLLNP